MATMFKKVAILGRHEDPRVSEPMTVLADYLSQAGVEVLAYLAEISTSSMTLGERLPVQL